MTTEPSTEPKECPTCGTTRTWLHWVAMNDHDIDGWSCVNGHSWAEAS